MKFESILDKIYEDLSWNYQLPQIHFIRIKIMRYYTFLILKQEFSKGLMVLLFLKI